MDFVNLAHGVQYMIGAYLTATAVAVTGHFGLGLVLGLAGALGLGFLLEWVLFRHLTGRDLDKVRVVVNGDGAEIVFTLFQRDGMSDDEMARDAAMVSRDLAALKALLEG